MKISLADNLKDLFNNSKKYPLLYVYFFAGLIVSYFCNGGVQGSLRSLINSIILLCWIILIRLFTPSSIEKIEIKKPHKEAIIIIFIYIYVFLVGLILNKVGVEVNNLVSNIALKTFFNAIINTIFLTVPMLLLSKILSYSFKDMGLVFNFKKLSLTLLAITILGGLLQKFISISNLHQTLLIYVIEIFISALPEELIFRGFILPRLEKALNNPIYALILTTILFNLVHLPTIIIQNHFFSLQVILQTILDCLFINTNAIGLAGLALGYLYLRTRSVVPGTLWHAACNALGSIFLFT